MRPPLDYGAASPGARDAMLAMERYVRGCGLDHRLLELVKVRASILNGCAFCLDMHTQDARALGETEQRLHGLAAWEETPFFTERERAALAWTDAVTSVQQGHVPDAVYEAARRQFAEKELVDLTLAIIAINGWNRLGIGFRTVPGSYKRK